MDGMKTNQFNLTPNLSPNRTKACLINATPPPWGVAEKKAILVGGH